MSLFELPEIESQYGVHLAGRQQRNDHDFYPTEPEATVALIEQAPFFTGLLDRNHTVCEPACGDGAIAKVFDEYGFGVIASDLINRGYGQSGVDFLKTSKAQAKILVTNPPFDLAEDFIRHSFSIGFQHVFMLLKATYFHTKGRIELFETHPLRRVMPLSWRLDFTGGGNPTMDCSWFEFDAAFFGEAKFGPILRKPTVSERCKNTIDIFGLK